MKHPVAKIRDYRIYFHQNWVKHRFFWGGDLSEAPTQNLGRPQPVDHINGQGSASTDTRVLKTPFFDPFSLLLRSSPIFLLGGGLHIPFNPQKRPLGPPHTLIFLPLQVGDEELLPRRGRRAARLRHHQVNPTSRGAPKPLQHPKKNPFNLPDSSFEPFFLLSNPKTQPGDLQRVDQLVDGRAHPRQPQHRHHPLREQKGSGRRQGGDLP